MSITQQCELLGLARSSYYYESVPEREENLLLMRLLDEQYTRTPFYGTRKMSAWLHTQGYPVDRKRVRRLLRMMGLEAIYPKPRTSMPGTVEQRYPYLLRGMSIERCNQVWSCDITYIRLARGFIYLMAVIDWKRPLRLVVGNLGHLGDQFLPGCIGSGLAGSHARDFQYGPGGAVYQRRVHQPAQGSSYSHQLGWQRTSVRQHFCGALMAQCEI